MEALQEIAVPADGPLVRWLRINEQVLSIQDADGDGILSDLEGGELRRHGVRLCLPLLSVNRLVAILLFASSHPLHLDDDDIRFLTSCGRQLGLICDAVGRHGAQLERMRAVQHGQRLAVAGQLAAAVAHEVRNPLTVIKSTVQLALGAGVPWDEKQALLEGVTAEVDRIEHTVSRLLNLSRPSDLERLDLDLVSIVEEAVAFVESYAESASVTFDLALARRPLPVIGDAKELRSLFLNLLLNSCQAMSTGGTISLMSALFNELTPYGTTRLMTSIEIRDNGPGMAPEVVEKVFDPFFTTRRSGTGLGLPISLEIAHRHGGDLRIASDLGRGTTVTILIPARSSDEWQTF